MKLSRKLLGVVAIAAFAFSMTIGSAVAAPETVTISGTVIDLGCATKGMAMMGSNYNAENDTHKTPKGEMTSCATKCLKGGQPAGLYKDGKVVAVFLANAKFTLSNYAQKNVEVQGFWGGSKDMNTFFPQKIREVGTSDWTEVQTSGAH